MRKLRPEFIAQDLSETTVADAEILVRDWPDDDEDEEDNDKTEDDEDGEGEDDDEDGEGYSE